MPCGTITRRIFWQIVMKYKALMIDVDGTLVPNQIDALPSEKVMDAVKKASTKIHVGIATGRPLHKTTYLLDHLSLSGPCILDGGIQIVDAKTRNILKETRINRHDIQPVLDAAKKLHIAMEVVEEERDITYYEGYSLNNTLALFTQAVDEKLADAFIESIRDIPTLAVHKTSSWVDNRMHVSVNHVSATKQHGILEIAKLLGIKTEEIIGIGDHYNDFPLLMACGLKVAMGNAVEDLKAIADYVAPTVDEDGVADVIKKFVL